MRADKHITMFSASTRAGQPRPRGKLVVAKLLALAVSLLLGFAAAPSMAQRPKDRPAVTSRIKREPVVSRGLAAVGYSKRLRALEIEFRDGSIYRYADVPRSLYRQLIESESKAGFYNRHIRKKFRSVRVKSRRKR